MAEEVPSGASDISLEDLSSFHSTHFSSISANHFAEHFLGPVEDGEYSGETEVDSLGYYEDGVMRTLTDEEIAIFRHSEIQTLLRDRRHAEETKNGYAELSVDHVKPAMDDGALKGKDLGSEEGALDEGELEDEISTSQPSQYSKHKKNKWKQNKNAKRALEPSQPKRFFKQNVKPDLRKRTWDKVDAGLGNLDYDEDSSTASAPSHASQRRRISYDDD